MATWLAFFLLGLYPGNLIILQIELKLTRRSSPEHVAVPDPLPLHAEIHCPQRVPERQHYSDGQQLRFEIREEENSGRCGGVRAKCHRQRGAHRIPVPLRLL